ncbi:CAP domain-containing protein [Streptomyces sp. TG1A-8]|uniref:CAP domain-containing protein n=1 Tax=Streptomyces sp. TG1A-8 TaxID=3051385 RepID=UPI00265C34CD|nr:CAP domain-containing protein [Streptomyces sp. TG1A-8]MDO0929303.1 CAP domain-containing protein [Streptomyces sp. TG1A-8]
MGKHRKKQYYRRMVISAAALATVGVPSVAMACGDWPGGGGADTRTHTEAYAGAAVRYDGDRPWHRGRSGEPAPTASTAPVAPPTERRTTEPGTKPGATASPAAPRTTAPVSTAPRTTAPAASSTPKATATATASGVTARIVELVNAERSKAGCSALTLNATLTKVAQAHSQDMASHRNMSHTGSDGSSPGDRITNGGYAWSAYGENIAYGYATAEEVMTGWMNSPGHRANILNCSFKEIGVGLAQPDSYWTQDFATAR